MTARLQHRLEIVSRSRRAAATLATVDLDETDRTLERIADDAARTAYSPAGSPESHAELAAALLEALREIEAIPGQPAQFGVDLEDGRLARVTRTIETD